MLLDLKTAHLAILMRCSRRLHSSLEPTLYSASRNRNEAVRWGCKHGLISTLRIAASYGASLHHVQVSAQDPPRMVSTLHLAIRSFQLDVCRFLLDAGVQIDARHEQTPALLQALRDPRYWAFLQLFVAAHQHAHIPNFARNVLSPALLEIVRRNDPPDAVQWLLDHGADPNFEARVRSIEKYPMSGMRYDPMAWKHVTDIESVLGTAILVNSESSFDMLIAAGANIMGVTREFDPEDYALLYTNTHAHILSKPHHIPIFAAIETIPKYGMKMMHRCLASGADINQRARVFCEWPSLNVTPLQYLILSKRPWHEFADVSFTEAIRDMLRRGATLDMSMDESRRVFSRFRSQRRDVVQLFMSSWENECLIYDVTLDFLSLLLEKGVLRKEVGEFLFLRAEQVVAQDLDVDTVAAWGSIVELLSANRADEGPDGAQGHHEVIRNCFNQLRRFESIDQTLEVEMAMIVYLLDCV